jgi:hypothetical protein
MLITQSGLEVLWFGLESLINVEHWASLDALYIGLNLTQFPDPPFMYKLISTPVP